MSVGRSLAWMGVAQGLSIVLQFTVQVVLARYLTPHDAGIYAVALAISGALALIQNLGLQSLIVREESLSPELVATTFAVQLAISVVVSLMIVAASFAGAAALGDPGVGRVLAALAVLPLIGAVSFMPMALLERDGRFKHIALVTTLGGIAGAIATILAALRGVTYMSVAYGLICNAVVVLVALWASARPLFRVGRGMSDWRRVARFGLHLLAINGINALGLRLSDIILPRFLGLAALGIYSRAGAMNGLIWANVHVLVGRVMLVDFAAIVREGRSLRERYITTVDVVTVLLWPIFAGFAVIAGPFIFYAFGPRWLPATVPIVYLATASMVLVSITMTWELFTARDRLQDQARIEFLRAIVALSLFVGGCMISIEAAAFSRILEAVFAVILYRRHISAMTDTRLADFTRIYLRNFLLALLAVSPAAGVMAVNGWAPDVSLLHLIPAVLAGALCWGVALLLLRHAALQPLRDLPALRRLPAPIACWVGAR